jgi:hypothetical protein
MRNLKILFILLFSSSFLPLFGQYTQIGNGGFTSAIYGPTCTDVTASFYNRHAYIYPSASLGNLAHGDTITALAFKHNAFDTLAGNCSFKMYIKNTANADFGSAALNWLAESRNGMTLVYEGNPKDIIGNSPGFAVFLFNKVSSYTFDTTGNRKHLEILVEYKQNTTQAAAIPWYCESAFYVPSFTSNNETKYVRGNSTSGFDSITNSSSIIKPTLRIYHPKHDTELEVNRVYALGKYPLLMDKPDSIKVVIRNIGRKTVYNHKVFLDVSGANSFNDTLIMDSLSPYKERFLYFTDYKPSLQGNELLTITSDSDAVASNNQIQKPRQVNYNVYSHVDPFNGNSGGIGFNGSTGDFVAKFYVEGTSYINQITVDFALTGRNFQLGIWDDDGTGGLPGTLLFISDSSISTAGTFIMPVLPKVQVNGGYYVGIRQTSNTNVSFAFQYEIPIRPHTFYFAAPAGDTSWVSFSPGYDYNFNIQPRLQVGNDLAILDIISPQPFDSIRYSATDSLNLTARVINYGFINQGMFNVKMDVLNRFNQVVQTDTRTASLNSGDTAVINFNKFSRFNIGQFKARATVDLNIDSVKDNNTLENTFYLVKDNDVAVDLIFEPTRNDSFEINEEGFWPTVRIINYGVKTQNNFKVRAELVDPAGTIVFSQEKTESLGPEVSRIINFDSIYLKKDLAYTFRAYTLLQNDSFPQNDTAKVVVVGKKTYDVKILSIIRPNEGSRFAKNVSFQPFINYRNDGRTKQDSTYFYARIENSSKNIVYTDTVLLATNFLSSGQVLFKSFAASEIGNYKFYVKCFVAKDQIRENDTMSSNFSVVTGNDLQLVKLLEPTGSYAYAQSTVLPKLVIRNNGLLAATTALIRIRIESNTNPSYYTDSIFVSLASFTTDTFKFNQSVPLDEIGDYFVTIENTRSIEDFRNSQDTIRTTYLVRYANDIGILSHLNPKDDDTLEYLEVVQPSIQIVNYGLDTIFDIRVNASIKNANGDQVYGDTLVLANLPANRAHNFISNQNWNADAGIYTLSSSLLKGDDLLTNNQLTTRFLVRKNYDISVDSILFPIAGEDLYVNKKYKPEVKLRNDGYEDADNIVVKCEVRINGSPLYLKSKIISILSYTDTIITFDSSLFSNEPRENVVASFIVSKLGDFVASNDSLSVGFNFVKGVSIEDFDVSQEIQVYPNPFVDGLTLNSSLPIAEISILDLSGKIVHNQVVNDQKLFHLYVPIAAGMYTLEAKTSGGIYRTSIVKIDE